MISKKKKVLTCLFLLTISVVITVVLYTSFRKAICLDKKMYQIDHDCVLYQLQHDDNPFRQNIADFENIYHLLQETDLYTYYELYAQPLYFGTTKGSVAALQISQNIQEDFSLTPTDGRLFTEEDFIFDNNTIPVCLGADYLNQYQLGDSFSAEYLYDEYHFVVVGLLEQNSMIKTSLKNILLDECIIMPSFNVSPNTPITDGLKIHYANKTSGIIKTTLEQEEQAQEYFANILESGNAGDYFWSSSLVSINMKNRFDLSLKTLEFILLVTILVLLVIAVIFYTRNEDFFLQNYQYSLKGLIEWGIFTIINCVSCGIILFVLEGGIGVQIQIIKYTALALIFDGLFYLIPNLSRTHKSRLIS